MNAREHEARVNLLLKTLGQNALIVLLGVSRFITVDSGSIVCSPDDPQDHAWFPLRGFFSVFAIEGQRSIEVGSFSVENVFVSDATRGQERPTLTATAQGVALKVPVRAMLDAQAASLPFACAVAADQANFARRSRQAAACVAFHHLPQRLASWLLRFGERATGGLIEFTQADIARFLSVERSRVNVYLQEFRDAGIVEFPSRGAIRIKDVGRLRLLACTCAAH